MGGIIAYGNLYALVYSRKACSLPAHDGNGNTVSSVNQISVLTFNFDGDFKNIKEYNLGIASQVLNVRGGKYGNNLLILVAKNNEDAGLKSTNDWLMGTEDSYAMLVGFDGSIKVNMVKTTDFLVSCSSDLRYLNDGRLAWSVVDKYNNVIIYYTKKPSYVSPHKTEGSIVLGPILGGEESKSSNIAVNFGTVSNLITPESVTSGTTSTTTNSDNNNFDSSTNGQTNIDSLNSDDTFDNQVDPDTDIDIQLRNNTKPIIMGSQYKNVLRVDKNKLSLTITILAIIAILI